MSYLEKIRAKSAQHGTDKTDKTSSVSSVSTPQGAFVEKNDDCGLAAKLRALGRPIALEVDGKPVCWLVADKSAESRTDVSPCFTAYEAAVLASFDAQGMRDLIEMKRVFGGILEADD